MFELHPDCHHELFFHINKPFPLAILSKIKIFKYNTCFPRTTVTLQFFLKKTTIFSVGTIDQNKECHWRKQCLEYSIFTDEKWENSGKVGHFCYLKLQLGE